MTTLPRILLAHRVKAPRKDTTVLSKQSHQSIRESAKRANLKFICDSVYDFVPSVISLSDAISAANAVNGYSHMIVDAQDAEDSNLFPSIFTKYDSGFIALNPIGNVGDYLRKTGVDFCVTDNHIHDDGTPIPFEEQLATALDLITKRITNGYFYNDNIFCARKNRVLKHTAAKNYELAQGRNFSWLK